MLRPAHMQRVSLLVLREDAPHAAMVLARSGVFNPETAAVPEEQLSELPAEHYREVYSSARARLRKIRSELRCTLDETIQEVHVVKLETLERLDERLGELWRQFSATEEKYRSLTEQRKALQQLWESLQRFAALDIDLALFQRPSSFLALRLGTIRSTNLHQLERAASLAGHFVQAVYSVGDTHYVVVAGPTEVDHDIQALLRTADFQPVKIPAEFQDHPEEIKRQLILKAAHLDGELAETETALEALGEEHREELSLACRTLTLAAPYAALASKLRGRGGLAVVEGWIPADELPGLRGSMLSRLDRPFVLNARIPLPEERSLVPTLLRHLRFFRPFAALVKNYGVPRYGEIDPTLLFAVTFIAMFGMMFGDVGHGAVIAVSGLLARKRFPVAVPFVVTAGLSSVVFGFVYGSIFGYEEPVILGHTFHPLWMSPLSDPLLMLKLALYWGIGFILLMNALTIRNLLDEGRYKEALLDNKGGAGTLLYLGGIFAGIRWMRDGTFGGLELAAVLLPLSVILVYKWREHESPLGEKILVVFVEGFESVMNYLANTLSFLRVAAFSLNHVALAIAVFTLADMMGTTGHWITVVLGNIFIIVLEGAIVTIQCLRLEYYEGFSRFFRGDGREFRPLKFGAPEA
jgi:V/A-type H+-transporting ATPase subunit I